VCTHIVTHARTSFRWHGPHVDARWDIPSRLAKLVRTGGCWSSTTIIFRRTSTTSTPNDIVSECHQMPSLQALQTVVSNLSFARLVRAIAGCGRHRHTRHRGVGREGPCLLFWLPRATASYILTYRNSRPCCNLCMHTMAHGLPVVEWRACCTHGMVRCAQPTRTVRMVQKVQNVSRKHLSSAW
jgi:hypothetical protein